VALGGLALLIWRIVNSELSRLIEKEPGAGMHEEYSARFGNHASPRKRPEGLKNTKTEVSSDDDRSRMG
jgi:hypothetical protein